MDTSQSSSAPSVLAPMLKQLPGRVTPNQIRGINADICIREQGADPSDWTISLKDGVCTVNAGAAAGADLTIEATSDVWQSLMEGRLDPGWAYMSGKLHVSGDLGLAMRLQSLLF